MTSGKPGTSIHFYRRRERADEQGYTARSPGRAAFMAGYWDGFMEGRMAALVARPEDYERGFDAGKADAALERLDDNAGSLPGLKAALRQARRTATRRLDDAGMPTERQGED